MTKDDVLKQLRNALAVEIQHAIQTRGFMPDDMGPQVKEILAGEDDSAMLALGMYLENERGMPTWEGLRYGLARIAEGQARRTEVRP